MGRLRRVFILPPLLLGAVGCGRGLARDAAVRAGDFQLSIDTAASILAPVTALPNDPTVVDATLNIWIDYILLAWAVNRGELERLDIDAILADASRRLLVDRLREEAIQLDTVITDDELEATFELERPGEEVRASHILFSMQAGLPENRRDSILSVADAVRERAAAGEDFARLAELFSDDRGSAAAGGDLGFFGRGEMVPPFEEMAFALEPGETSGVVESEFGFHVIRVEERRFPTLSEIAEEYRVQLQRERVMVAESTYLAELEGPANVQVPADAVALVRRISENPAEELSGSEEAAAVVIWVGGEYAAGEYREFIAGQPPEVRAQIANAADARIEVLLHDLARDQLLIRATQELGLELSEADEAALQAQVVGQYRMIANLLAVDSLEVADGDTLAETVEGEVLELMRRVVASEQDLIPLGTLAEPLRTRYRYQLATDAALRVVARVGALRGGGAGAPDPAAPAAEAAGPNSVP